MDLGPTMECLYEEAMETGEHRAAIDLGDKS